MNLAEARIVLRPRRRLELLDLAFPYVLGDSRGAIGRLATLTLLPAFGAAAFARAMLAWHWWQVWALTVLLGMVASGVFTVASGRLLFERALDLRTVLREYGRRVPSFMVALLVSRGLVVLGSLLILPGLFAWMRYSFVAEAVLLEQVPVRRALKRSTLLSREGGDGIFGMLVATLAFSVMVALAVETMSLSILHDVLVLPFESDTLLEDGGSYFSLAGYLASVPWAAAGRFLAYIDGRTRQDGWDVQVRLMALGGDAG